MPGPARIQRLSRTSFRRSHAGAAARAGGGYRIDGVDVCGEECSEGLDTVDVHDGLGLAPFAVDLHAAQAGTVSRAVAAVAAGLMEWAVAIDDNTAAVLSRRGDEDYEVIGTGNCWDIRLTGGGATVSVRSPGGRGWRFPALVAAPDN